MPEDGNNCSFWDLALFSYIKRCKYSPWIIAISFVGITLIVLLTEGTVQEVVFILYGAPIIYTVLVYDMRRGSLVAVLAAIAVTLGRAPHIAEEIAMGKWDHVIIKGIFIPTFYILFCLGIGKLILNERQLREEYRLLSEELSASAEELAEAYETTTSLFTSTIQALAAAIDAKDPYTRGHSERVTKYALDIARALRLPEEEVQRIFYASILHDIGKIGVSGNVLRKPGKLTQKEYEEVCRHPYVGANIISSIQPLKEVLPLIYHHHECFDGSGYPEGKAGEEIPLGARIIAVADAYDAMTSDRPYRRAFPKEKAIEELKKNSGKQFDPEIVKAFLKVLENSDDQPPVVSTWKVISSDA
ncbi:HD-GYP domain-containing protein [Calderihabitans maritimus]|uniref:Metal dependent phosphohydrolase n=1 Tax=Calderihabitans maritimus TaxID=1246530 RepID=A0A1Z5HS99_9FIRM|nr:HD-GYP domain-containing protein [Calderihabitans maritimus]GAW92394.1 metal dependent phosphohydrolase [Calderihabitans maritimus]